MLPHGALNHVLQGQADTVRVELSAEKQIRSQMLNANSSSARAGTGQEEAAAADTAALMSDKLHTDTSAGGGGITVVEEPLGVAKAKDSDANQQSTAVGTDAAVAGAAGISLRDAVKQEGGGAVAAGGAQQTGGGKEACLPTKWTGNPVDYKLTKCAPVSPNHVHTAAVCDSEPCVARSFTAGAAGDGHRRAETASVPAQGSCHVPHRRAQYYHGDVGELPLPGLRDELGGARAERRRDLIPGWRHGRQAPGGDLPAAMIILTSRPKKCRSCWVKEHCRPHERKCMPRALLTLTLVLQPQP